MKSMLMNGAQTWWQYRQDGENEDTKIRNDYLGTPRYITSGNDGSQTEDELIGEQAFGPYGEQMIGTFQTNQNNQNTSITLPWGYRPATGYTGHINEDETGLIYMRGRYYSPLWHRFINSDQGVDPNSLNQYAYVGGMPFMATDPSGMTTLYTYDFTCGGSLVFSLILMEELTAAERLATGLMACGIAGATVQINGSSSPADYYGWMFGSSPYGGSTTPRIDPGNNPPNKNDKPQEAKPPCNPTITVSGDGVTTADRKLFTDAINLLNSARLTANQISVLGHLRGINLFNSSSRSGIQPGTGILNANVNEFRGQITAWNATQIAHDAYHEFRYKSGIYTGTNIFEERLAMDFQIGIGIVLGIDNFYLNYLLDLKNNPEAIQNRINEPCD